MPPTTPESMQAACLSCLRAADCLPCCMRPSHRQVTSILGFAGKVSGSKLAQPSLQFDPRVAYQASHHRRISSRPEGGDHRACRSPAVARGRTARVLSVVQAARISGARVRYAALVFLFATIVDPSSSGAAFAGQKRPVPAIRWADGQPGCTFSLDEDGKYRYGLWTTDFGIIMAVDSQELEKVHRRVEPVFSVQITVRYRGQGTLAVDPKPATLEFVKHSKVMQRSLDPESFALRAQDDADEFEHETEREIAKHPERKDDREKFGGIYEEKTSELIDFLTRRSLSVAQLDASHPEISGWVLFSTRSKWIGGWKKPEEFVLRFPIDDGLVEFPFLLPARERDLILRKRTQ
jgi:hypothetical protein